MAMWCAMRKLPTLEWDQIAFSLPQVSRCARIRSSNPILHPEMMFLNSVLSAAC